MPVCKKWSTFKSKQTLRLRVKMKAHKLTQDSYKELAEVITNSASIQQDIKDLLKAAHHYDIATPQGTAIEAQAFVAHTFRSGTANSYQFSTGVDLALATYYGRASSKRLEILPYIPLPILQKITTPRVFNREKASRLDAKFDASAKVLEPNTFSYVLFETYLETLKTPLTGKDALRYMGMIHHMPRKFRTLFMKLLWDKAVRTQKMIKEFSYLTTEDHENPFAIVGDTQKRGPDGTYCKFYHIPHHMYNRIMWRSKMPITAEFMNVSETMFPLYVYGVPRKAATNEKELQPLLEKINLLNYYEMYELVDKDCPYFRGTKEQLLTIMKACPTADFNLHRERLKRIITSFEQTLKDITW